MKMAAAESPDTRDLLYYRTYLPMHRKVGQSSMPGPCHFMAGAILTCFRQSYLPYLVSDWTFSRLCAHARTTPHTHLVRAYLGTKQYLPHSKHCSCIMRPAHFEETTYIHIHYLPTALH